MNREAQARKEERNLRADQSAGTCDKYARHRFNLKRKVSVRCKVSVRYGWLC
jgi:hypothetical protein